MPDCVIIPADEWQAVQDNLKHNKKNVGRKTQYHYLLNGIIKCGNCGGEMVGIKKVKSGSFTYRCKSVRRANVSSCDGSRGINILKLETFIIEHLFNSKGLKDLLVNAPRNTSEAKRISEILEDKTGEVNQLTKRINKISKLLLDPDLEDDDLFLTQYKDYKKKLALIKIEVADLNNELRDAQDANRNERTKSIIESYTTAVEFDDLKHMIHDLIGNIEVKYNKEAKGGYFLIAIKYKNYEEQSMWSSNRQLMKWMMLQKYTGIGAGPIQLEEDRESAKGMLEFEFGVTSNEEYLADFPRGKFAKTLEKDDITDEELDLEIDKGNPFSSGYVGTETIHGTTEIITLQKENILDFD